MALTLSAAPETRKVSDIPPLAPIIDPATGKPAQITRGGITLAVCGRYPDRPAEFVLCKHRPHKPATADYSPEIKAQPATGNRPAVAARKQIGKPERPAGWVATAKLCDWHSAIAGGLIAPPQPVAAAA